MRKRIALILLTALSLLVLHPDVGWAQQGLNVNRIFQQYGHAKGYKMVEMNDAKLKGYALHVYKSLVFKRQNAQIDEWLGLDRTPTGWLQPLHPLQQKWPGRRGGHLH